MDTPDILDWEILNATADDCENLEQIYRQICYEVIEVAHDNGQASYAYRPVPGAPLLSDVANRIGNLVERGYLAVAMDDNGESPDVHTGLDYVWRAWFRMTTDGSQVWQSAACFVEEEKA